MFEPGEKYSIVTVSGAVSGVFIAQEAKDDQLFIKILNEVDGTYSWHNLRHVVSAIEWS